MTSLSDKRMARDAERARTLGTAHAECTPFATYARDRDSERLYRAACDAGSPRSAFDIFKYAAQAVWRARGEI